MPKDNACRISCLYSIVLVYSAIKFPKPGKKYLAVTDIGLYWTSCLATGRSKVGKKEEKMPFFTQGLK